MNRATGGGAVTVLYTLAFFTFLFGPLVIMVITAFNSSSFPRIVPWECFTTDWFGVFFSNRRLMEGLGASIVIGVLVVALSVPLGLAGAIALTEISPRLRTLLYTVLIAPILIPGVVLGISTVVFWGALARSLNVEFGTFFYNGFFLTVVGQITFISAYAMLIFIARLQRFDPTLTEAALDLGASPGMAFRRIMLPFLAPAFGSAAFLTLLASFENYNTTVFTILSDNTFTTALASKVRLGTDPSLSALAVIIITITLVGAIVNEAWVQRSQLLRTDRASRSRLYANPFTRALTHPLGVALLLAAILGIAVWQGSRHDSSVCEANVIEQKRAVQQQLLDDQRARQQQNQPASPAGAAAGNPSPFGAAFGPGSLAPSSPDKPADAPAPTANPSPFGNAFKPTTLAPGGS